MTIGVKDTQDIIRQVVVLSRKEAVHSVKLEPQDVGMATGPRQRTRSLLRPDALPDYLDSSAQSLDEWQKLDDDIYRFLQIRKDQFAKLSVPPSHQFLAEMESQLKFNDSAYELGAYLGLLRQAADLDQTRHTLVTVSERSAFHAFARRITEARYNEEPFDPGMVKRYLELLESNQDATYRGLADLLRLISRAARQPLIGAMRDAPRQSIVVILNVIDVAIRFNQSAHGRQGFQIGPMDVFLGARTVLFNRSVVNPTLSMLKELVLDRSGLYHEDLNELLKSVGVFGSEFTLQMPETLSEQGFALKGSKYSAVELVMAAGTKLTKSAVPVNKAMVTLADAILHKVQQQDAHKDKQIQSILGHFNRLMIGERRSAARLTQERQDVRFDYMTAIQRASQLAKGMQTGQFRALEQAEAILPNLAPSPEPQPSATMVLAKLSSREYESLLVKWDTLLGRIRKKLTTKSPVFKTLALLLARVRSLDTCLAYGLTPAGSRCTSRLAKLLQGEEMRIKFKIPLDTAEVLEQTLSRDYPAFLASLESLILALYGFRPGLQTVQFRTRDRRFDLSEAAQVSGEEEDQGELDSLILNLILGALFLGNEIALNGGKAPQSQFKPDGTLCFPDSTQLQYLGSADPFSAYIAFLWAGKKILTQAPLSDLKTSLLLMSRLTPDWQELMARKYRDIKNVGSSAVKLPQVPAECLRKGWENGFEKGFMEEIRLVVEEGSSALQVEARLGFLLVEIQSDVDKACEAVENEKLKLTRDQVFGILN